MKKLLNIAFIANNRFVILNVYQYLLVIFAAALMFRSLGWLDDGIINFLFLSCFLGLGGIFLSAEDRDTIKIRIPKTYPLVLFFLALIARIYPYLNTKIPLGYDPGMYKYAFEHPGLESLRGLYSRLFLTIMGGLSSLFGSYSILVPLNIIITSLTVLIIYFVIKRLFNPETGLLASMLFVVSITQYDVFSFYFFKNAFGIILLLVSFLFFEKASVISWQLILIGCLIGSVHRPAFLLFGLTLIAFVAYQIKTYSSTDIKNAIINGLLILIITLITNSDRISEYYFSGAITFIDSARNFDANGGFYYSFLEYLYRNPIMIAFILPGIIFAPKRSLPILITGIILVTIIVFKLQFYRRFILYLDLVIIIFAASGLGVLIKDPFINRRIPLGLLVSGVIVLSLGLQLAQQVLIIEPLVTQDEFNAILRIDDEIEPGATVLLTDSFYGPWFRGWLDAALVVPGLFEADLFSYEQWEIIWYGDEEARIKVLRDFHAPLYIHQGIRTKNLREFSGKCFNEVDIEGTHLYQFACWK